MASSKQKGDKQERLAKQELEKLGWLVYKSPRTMRRVWTPKGPMYVSKDNDIWNLFDIMAIRKGCIRFIQVKYGKAKTHVSDSKNPIEDFYKLFIEKDSLIDSSIDLEIWYKPFRGRSFEKIFFNGNAWCEFQECE